MKQDRLVLTAGFMPAVLLALFMLLERAAGAGFLSRSPWASVLAELGVYLIPLGVLRLLTDGEGKRACFRFQGYRRQAGWLVVWMSLAAGLFSILAGSLLSLAMGRPYESGVFLLGLEAETPLLSAVLPALAAAVIRELFFRGAMFSALERCGTWPALLLTSAAWAALQGKAPVMAGALASGLVYGYLTYVLGSVWPAMTAHGLQNLLALLLERSGKTYTALGIWQYILLILCFFFCLFLALGMRALEKQIEKGRVRRFQHQPPGVTLTAIFMSPGMWLLAVLVLVRVLY